MKSFRDYTNITNGLVDNNPPPIKGEDPQIDKALEVTKRVAEAPKTDKLVSLKPNWTITA